MKSRKGIASGELDFTDKVYERIKLKMVMRLYGLTRSAAQKRLTGQVSEDTTRPVGKPTEKKLLATRRNGGLLLK